MSALNATKRDLAEFVSVLGSDTKAAVKEASDNFNKILGPPEDSASAMGVEEDTKKKNGGAVVDVQAPYDRCQAELFSIQNSTDTYLQDPPNGRLVHLYVVTTLDLYVLLDTGNGDFERWKSTFAIQSYQTDISNLLVSCSLVRGKHSQLVPAKVSYETFWMRYFYKTHQLEKVCLEYRLDYYYTIL